MSKHEIGPKEAANRAMRERRIEMATARSAPKVEALRERVAAIPARKQKKVPKR